MPHKGSFQYQGIAEPLPQGPLPPLNWQPKFPDRTTYERPSLLAAILAGAFFFTPIVGNAQQASTGDTAQIHAGRQIQYQSQVAPFAVALVPPPVVPTIDGWGQPPSQPQLRAAPLLPQDWAPSEAILRQIVTHAIGASTPLVPYPVDLRQYQSQVAPFFAALTPPVAVTVEWLPSYPDLIPSARPAASLVAFYAEFDSVTPLGHVGWQGSQPDRIDRREFLAAEQRAAFVPTYLPIHDLRWQGTFPDQVFRIVVAPEPFYVAEPFPRPTVVTVTLEWLPAYPDRFPAPIVVPAGLSEPPSSARALGHVGWLPSAPDWIARTVVRAADQQAIFEPRFLPIHDLRWAPDYPNQIDRLQVRAADQPFLFAPRYLPIADLRWQGSFPDQVLRPVVRAADQQAAFAVRYYPVDDLRWAGSFPEQVIRLLPAPWLGVAVFYPFPFPNEPAPILSWQPNYPNWIWRTVLPVAAVPFTGPQNLEPIPNEFVSGNDVITLGVEIGVVPYPVLGGWVPF